MVKKDDDKSADTVVSGRSARIRADCYLTGDSSRRGSPQFPDPKRRGRCGRRDDGSLCLGRRENSEGRRHDAAAGQAAQAATPPPLSADLDVVKKGKGPVLTTVDEFYKVGRARRARTRSVRCASPTISTSAARSCRPTKLAKATELKVNLFGSLSATGKGHGTERAALAGLVGKEPATVDPTFLDSLRDKPDQAFPVKLGDKSINVSLKDVIYDATKGDFQHPNTMTVKLLAGNEVLLEQEYYSVGGGFIEWKGYTPPKKNAPKYPFATMKELRQHADNNKTVDRQGHAGQRDVDRGQESKRRSMPSSTRSSTRWSRP